MPMPTKREREDAALICDIAASSGTNTPYSEIAPHLGLALYEGAHALAVNTWGDLSGTWDRAMDAEAAQLLREGYTPRHWSEDDK